MLEKYLLFTQVGFCYALLDEVILHWMKIRKHVCQNVIHLYFYCKILDEDFSIFVADSQFVNLSHTTCMVFKLNFSDGAIWWTLLKFDHGHTRYMGAGQGLYK